MKTIVSFFLFSTIAFAAHSGASLEALKMDKRFGIGLTAAGGLSLFGLEVDINVTEDFSLSGGLGTGLDYSTVAVKGRYFLLGKSVSPYIGVGFARWWSDSLKSRDVAPSLLSRNFLADDLDPSKGFNIFLAYPMLGVQYMHPMGIEISVEAMYLFKLLTLANGAYAGLGVHWYF